MLGVNTTQKYKMTKKKSYNEIVKQKPTVTELPRHPKFTHKQLFEKAYPTNRLSFRRFILS